MTKFTLDDNRSSITLPVDRDTNPLTTINVGITQRKTRTMTTSTHTIEIDPDILVSELLEQWQNGNKNDVIHQLKTDHAGLTALFITEGLIHERILSRMDCNEITNRLIDDRVELYRK